jgi:hypothetical protein
MGRLVARRYPTKVFATLADHTYVECGTGGKAWSCWGGKTGGTALVGGDGSTLRADQIAGANERGGITCYLINGVCHQAANRILLPASLTVRGARGYEVSEALFGTYGRTGGILGVCQAPFHQHAGTTGDLPACAATASRRGARRGQAPGRAAAHAKRAARERRYLRGVLAIYRRAATRPSARAVRATRAARVAVERDLEALHLELFMHQVDFRLRSKIDRRLERRLRSVRRSTERSRLKIEEWFADGQMSAAEFAKEFDMETAVFQHAAAGAMTATQYRKLFDLEPGDIVTLADPRIIRKAFARG